MMAAETLSDNQSSSPKLTINHANFEIFYK